MIAQKAIITHNKGWAPNIAMIANEVPTAIKQITNAIMTNINFFIHDYFLSLPLVHTISCPVKYSAAKTLPLCATKDIINAPVK